MMIIDKSKKLYMMFPASRTNPLALLDGDWVIREIVPGQQLRHGKIVARFKGDGRDKAEAWLLKKQRESTSNGGA